MSKKMLAVVEKCLGEGDTFSLFIQGALHEDSRRLIAFKIGDERKQTLAFDQVTRFNLMDFRFAMNDNHFDFVELPQPETFNTVVWAFKKIKGNPKHTSWMRSKQIRGVLPQATALAPMLKEFVIA